MLDFAYLIFILLLIMYLMLARRKEMPFVVLSHVLIQYFFASVAWVTEMDSRVAAVLLLFLVSSSSLIIWARNLNYSRETKMIRIFVNLSQWTILLILIGFLVIEPNYLLHYSSSGKNAHFELFYTFTPPLFKICGSLLLFSTFLLFILNWGQSWDIKKSLKNFLPVFLYLFILCLLYFASVSVRNLPFT